MASDFEIGRVVAVDTSQVTIELSRDLKALARGTYEGMYEVGRINAYVSVPVGARRLVGMITRIVLMEDAEMTPDRTMVALPAARRMMKATLIGTIDGPQYSQGVTLFPVLDSPAYMVSEMDLRTIFDHQHADVPEDPEEPGYCVYLGESPIFAGYPVKLNPDAFFGKHAAVIGSTGSGKSCTIASIIQSILSRPEVRRAHFVILDTNGEYRSAFQRKNTDGSWSEVLGEARSLYIPSDNTVRADRLVIPYWFMNSEDFVRLFRASAGIQRPVLLDALRMARAPASPGGTALEVRRVLLLTLHRLMAQVEDAGNVSAQTEDAATGCLRYVAEKEADLGQLFGDAGTQLRNFLTQTGNDARTYVGEPDGRRFSRPLPVDVQQGIVEGIRPLIQELVKRVGPEDAAPVTADNPIYFEKESFRREHLERAMHRDEAGGARAREYCATMLMRLYRLLEDRRFEFLFGPVDGQWPSPEHSLAAFVRDCLGLQTATEPQPALSDAAAIARELLPYYDRQRSGSAGHRVTVIDLSLLASEVLENVTALVGRVILEFLQRVGETGGEQARGSLPVVLVLEEAQNYIRDQRSSEEESISRGVFERIAREGRKYGLSLVVASQRPSELSKTVLSQCSSFIVHRLQNPEDLRYFREIVPAIYATLLEQLPALSPQTALVLGECVRAPALVRIRDARPVPRSRDPKFYKYWTAELPVTPDVEAICRAWEGRSTPSG